MSYSLSSTISVLALIAALAVVDYSVACAPTKTNTTAGRRKRSIEDDVHVIVASSEPFDLSKAGDNMVTVEMKLRKFAEIEGISFKQLEELPRTSENVGGKFGVHFTVEAAFEKCSRVLQFIQAACNEITEVVSGTVKCGSFDAVTVIKKVIKVEKNAERTDKAEEAKNAAEGNGSDVR
ncbi:hypothetical protein PRIPAC_71952 [Pristionchus pacificus]|nr:hypothetical protein PRIPAC_71952 [Pristionchus pacificus]